MTASCSPAGKRLMGIKNVRLVSFSMSSATSPILTMSTPSAKQSLLNKHAVWPGAKPDFKHVCCSQGIPEGHTAEPEQLPPERWLQQCLRGLYPVCGVAPFCPI